MKLTLIFLAALLAIAAAPLSRIERITPQPPPMRIMSVPVSRSLVQSTDSTIESSSCPRLDGYTFSFSIESEFVAFAVERTTDLTNWTEIARNLDSPGVLKVILDCDATNAAAFYRLKAL